MSDRHPSCPKAAPDRGEPFAEIDVLQKRDPDTNVRSHPLRRGLGRRILVWFLVLSLLPLFLSNSVGYGVSRRIIERQVHEYLQALVEVQADHVAHQVELHQLRLEAMVASSRFLPVSIDAASEAVTSGQVHDPAVIALQSFLRRRHREMAAMSELYVLDASGITIGATRPKRLGSSLSETDLFATAVGGRFFIGEWGGEGGATHSVFRLATRINDDAGGTLGVLGATVDPEEQREFLDLDAHLGPHVEAFVLCAAGRPLFVSHAHGPVDYGQRLQSPLVEMPPGSVATYVNYEGAEVIGISVPIGDLPWLYVAELPISAAFGQLRGLRLLSAALEGLFALALVGIVWLVAASIVSPLRRLVWAAERIRSGDLKAHVRVDSADELGELSETFNQMARGLRESASEIQELHEQEMRRAEQLASVGELAAGVAHEIKNPLAGATSGIDMLEDAIRGEPVPEKLLAQVRIQLRRIDSAIRDLLSYARPTQPTKGHVAPEQLVERAEALVRSQAEAAGVRVERSPSQTTRSVSVDPELVTQALVNLSLNAIQAMPEGGVLTFGIGERSDEIAISVQDTGSGMSAEVMDKIFRPFFTTKHRGTGLGLAITRSIVERHGGHVEVESAPGSGSTFTLVLSTVGKESV
jgi:signal transduction histidine kinase